MKTQIILKDEVNVKIENLSAATRKKLHEKYSYLLPYARHVPAFKMGRWDGKVNFFTFGALTYLNLLDEILPILIEEGYEVELIDNRVKHDLKLAPITIDHFKSKTWPVSHVAAGQSIVLRDYQHEAINTFIQNPQCIQCIATGGGKTLITAALSNLVEEYGRTIIIVPSKSLVVQTEEDYVNLGLDVGVYFGDRKELGHKHTICTWQSLSVLEKRFKSGESIFGLADIVKDTIAVIVDECHGVKADELKGLLGQSFAHIPLRWGFTGTIPKEQADAKSLMCFVGPVMGSVTAKELQDKGVLSNCKIEIVQLQDDIIYSDYQTELTYLLTNEARLTAIANIINNLPNKENTLVLVNKIKTGESLIDKIKDSVFVSGAVKTLDRKDEYDQFQQHNGKILVATYGVAAVGINILRIHNVILVEPGKSFVRVIQSIGRGLRKGGDKDFVNIYDICSNAKYSKRHLTERKKFYKEAEYDFQISKLIWK